MARCAGVLSRLRPLVDSTDRARIVATRETVAFDPHDADIDLATIRRSHAAGISSLATDELTCLAGLFRGEFLEGIDLPDLHDFQAWCLAEREDLRRVQIEILSAMLRRTTDKAAALPHARQLVQIDPFNAEARIGLLDILARLGRHNEAEQHFESSMRLLSEVGDGAERALVRAWQTIRSKPPAAADAGVARTPAAPIESNVAISETQNWSGPDHDGTPLVGRESEMKRLQDILDAAFAGSRVNVVLVTGEPGIGKTRITRELDAQGGGERRANPERARLRNGSRASLQRLDRSNRRIFGGPRRDFPD